MIGFGRKKDKPKKRSKLDKLIMGAIVGGAVGSVIGMTIAPKSGKETREYLAQKGKQLYEKGNEIKEGIKEGMKEKFDQGREKKKRRKFFSWLKDTFFRRRERKQTEQALREQELKKIPHEVE